MIIEPIFAIEFNELEAATTICKMNSTCSLIFIGDAPIIRCNNPENTKLPFGWYYKTGIGFTNKHHTHSGEYTAIKVVTTHF